MQKLSRRTFVSDPSTLGPGLLPLWERLNAELVEVGSVHTELERKIGEECEMVLRSAPERGEWGRIREVSLVFGIIWMYAVAQRLGKLAEVWAMPTGSAYGSRRTGIPSNHDLAA